MIDQTESQVEPCQKSDSLEFSLRLFSLLRYYQQGKRGTFDGVIKKALGREAQNFSVDAGRHVKNLIYNRLNDFGLIEVCGRKKDRWVAHEDGVIQLNDEYGLVFGTQRFTNYAVRGLDWSFVEEHVLYRLPKINGSWVDLGICLPKVPVALLTRNLNFQPSTEDIGFISKYLPSLTAMYKMKSTATSSSIATLGSIERFDFKNMSWTPIHWTNLENDLLRTAPTDKYRGGIVRNFVCVGPAINGNLHEIDSTVEDWKYFFAARLFDLRLDWKHDAGDCILSIPTTHIRERILPLMIRRLLLLQSFKWPIQIKNNYLFGQIGSEFYQNVVRRFSFLGGSNVK